VEKEQHKGRGLPATEQIERIGQEGNLFQDLQGTANRGKGGQVTFQKKRKNPGLSDPGKKRLLRKGKTGRWLT